MSSHRLLRPDDMPPQRWRNGGGVTRELLAWPSPDDWRVRVSVAEIGRDGPFSTLPGVRRWFAVLKGAGVVLRIDDVAHRLTRNDAPFAFDGAAGADCRLIDGPTRDLNLMLRGASGAMRLADDGAPWTPDASMCGLFTAVAGCCAAGTDDIEVPAYALLWFDPAPASLSFTAGARPASATGWWLAATPDGARA
jgi:uncharacterized protein